MISVDKLKAYIDFLRYKSVLCLDGDLTVMPALRDIGLPVIATDGAANKLLEMGTNPALVIGDLDSVDMSLLGEIKYEQVIDQSRSDFQKALWYMSNCKLLPTIICGINGGYIDHIINNVNIFMQGRQNVFVTNDIVGYPLYATHNYTFPVGTKISIIGMPECTLTSNGLKWELQNYTTTFPGENSCFNRVHHTPLHLTIHSGTALMMIYTHDMVDAGSG